MVKVAKTLYPLDWDSRCSDESFNTWLLYVRREAYKMAMPKGAKIPNHLMPVRSEKSTAKGQVLTLLEAKRILRNGSNN